MATLGPFRVRTLRDLLAAATLAACACSRPPAFNVRGLDTGRLGEVRVRLPSDDARAFVMLFSAASGWGTADEHVAAALTRRGVIVVGVDLPAYRAALDADEGECLYLLSEVESLSQQVQRRVGLTTYLTPILAGSAEAATLVRAMLAQSPDATIAGAVAVDPVAVLHTRLPLCAGADFHADGGGFRYDGPTALPGFLSIAFSSQAEDAGREQVRDAVRGGAAGDIANNGLGQTTAAPAPELLEERIAEHLSDSTTVVEDIPGWLIESPAAGASRTLAVVFSGDGGWRDLDKSIAEALHDRGVNVLGWDCLRYFWSTKTPEQLAKDLDERIRRGMRDWHVDEVVVIGYSFGADALPFAYNRLPEATRSRVRLMSLLGLSDSADFEFHVTGWLGAESDDALPTLPELAEVPAAKVQCFYGEEDEDEMCSRLAARGVEVIRTSGSHHFDGDYAALAVRILDGVARRRSGGPER